MAGLLVVGVEGRKDETVAVLTLRVYSYLKEKYFEKCDGTY
jgi:hypothetical protein